jgi:uncharacterized protein (TIGR02453 family)
MILHIGFFAVNFTINFLFMRNVIDFLKALKENNTREWFTQNKDWYDKTRAQWEQYTANLIMAMQGVDKSLGYLEPKDCIFRIYRDVRFSADKSPYKSNMGAWLVKGGKKSPMAGYYLHIEPDNCFISGGLWMPLPEHLKKVRRSIFENADEFVEIVESAPFKKFFGKVDGSALKSAPKDYPKDWKHIDYLKQKDYLATRPLSEEMLYKPNFWNEVTQTFTAMKPFISFLNHAIEE